MIPITAGMGDKKRFDPPKHQLCKYGLFASDCWFVGLFNNCIDLVCLTDFVLRIHYL